jgi:methionyl-tRNA formyltransferase
MKLTYRPEIDGLRAIDELKKIRITLFTNNLRGISCLKYLINKKVQITNIVISKKNLNPKVIVFLNKNKIKFINIKNLKSEKVLKILDKTELGLICGFPHIFKEFQFNIPKYGLINLHAGKLPEYRGGSPLNWQIINNEKYFGISVIKIDKGIDTGDIIFEKKFKLLNKYKIEDLHRIANNFFPRLLYKSIFRIISGKKLKKQDERKANYYRQRRREDSLINPSDITFKKLTLLLRAMSNSYPSPYVIHNNKKIIIKKIKISKSNLNFKSENILVSSNKIFLKLKDKIIKIIKTK